MKTTQTLLLAATLSAGLLAATGVNAALVGSLDGKTVYNPFSNLTWAANANLAASNSFGLTYGFDYDGSDNFSNPSVINSDGTMTWGGAQKWIAAMNTANYLGYSDWRLPFMIGDNCATYNCIGSEMGQLFYWELGQVAGKSISTSTDPDKAKFTNLQSGSYWYGTEIAPVYIEAWFFNTRYGRQGHASKDSGMYALAVRDGQVAAVPVPAAAWLLGSGLLGLTGVARRKAA